MSSQVSIGISQRSLALHPEDYYMHYLTAYLGAVIGCLSRRGMVIHTVERTLYPHALGCSNTFDPPASAWTSAHWPGWQATLVGTRSAAGAAISTTLPSIDHKFAATWASLWCPRQSTLPASSMGSPACGR